jgi:thiol:disulfide interchange protein DsbA
MKARLPKPLTVETVPEHPVLGERKRLLEREPEILAEYEAEFKRVKPGFVYKRYAYWTELLTGEDRGWLLPTDDRKFLLQTIRDTFDGIFFTEGASTSDFPLLYRGFTRAYGRRCRDILEDPISITITRTETDQYGYQKEEVSAPFVIETSFYQKFDAYEPLAIDYAARTGMRMAMRGSAMGSILEGITRHDDTVDKVLSGLSCTSATMRQLRMNFWLRAYDRPSLQESGERIPGSEAESQVGVLQAQLADFEAKMSALKTPATKNQKYSLIDPPSRAGGESGTEIVYLYNYDSPNSWLFEQHIKTWLKKEGASSRFVRIPKSPDWYAPVFYTAQKLGIEEEIHNAIFERIHVTKRPPNYGRAIVEMFEQYGVSPNDQYETGTSPGVLELTNRAEQIHAEHLHSTYSWSDLPKFLVNGKYRVSTATCLCGPEEMLVIVTELAQKAD